jgi:membrane protease YdiL (CAAX protease family)
MRLSTREERFAREMPGGGSAAGRQARCLAWRITGLILLTLALGTAGAGLLKAGIERALPSADWLARAVELRQVGDSYDYDLGRVSRRVLVALLLLVLLLTRRSMPWGRFTRQGLARHRGWWKLWLAGGAAAGALVLAFSALIVLGGPVRWLHQTPGRWVSYLLQYAVGGTLVGLAEEIFFRGMVFRAMARDWGGRSGVLVSSLVFAVLHCISGSLRVGPGWEPLVGLRLLVAYFTDGGSLWADGRLLVGLFLLGCLQAVLFGRTGSLWVASGFHAGLYFFSKVMKKVYRPDAFPRWLVGDPVFVVSGVLAWVLLAVLLALALRVPRGWWRRVRRDRSG